MDPQFEIMHVVDIGSQKPFNLVCAELSPQFNRKSQTASVQINFNKAKSKTSPPRSKKQKTEILDSATDLSCLNDPVSVIWEKRLLENPRLFNATKFRIHSVMNSKTADEKVVMQLGVTDYKEYLGTNWAPNVEQLQEKGLELYGNSQAFLSDALGVGASVVTKDNSLVLLKRSEHCAEAPALWDVPGGHAEPKEIVGDKPLQEIDVSAMKSDDVVHEIFDSIIREITDEVNIPLKELKPPLYTGTHRNTTSAGRPSLAFEIRCTLTCKEILSLYNQGSQPEADESTNIMFFPFEDIASLDTKKLDLWEKLAPSAKGNLTCLALAHGLKKPSK